MRQMLLVVVPAVLVAVLVAGGCKTTPPAGESAPIVVVPGQTTREEMMLALGYPLGAYEQDRVLVWSIATDAAGAPVLRRPAEIQYGPYGHELVATFGSRGRVEQYNTVRVRH